MLYHKKTLKGLKLGSLMQKALSVKKANNNIIVIIMIMIIMVIVIVVIIVIIGSNII